jgi:hypothetical protein
LLKKVTHYVRLIVGIGKAGVVSVIGKSEGFAENRMGKT